MNIAGHHFPDNEWVKKCSRCERRLCDILSTQEDEVGQPGIACYGNLSISEYHSIAAYREAIYLAGLGKEKEPESNPEPTAGELFP